MPSRDIETRRAEVDARVARLEGAGVAILRYGIGFLLVVIGAAKYFAFEAEAIRPLVEHSPFLSWMLRAFGLQTTSSLIGTAEIATGSRSRRAPFRRRSPPPARRPGPSSSSPPSPSSSRRPGRSRGSTRRAASS